jgi:phosphotransferase family enzyme
VTRTVTLILVDRSGEVLGRLPEFEVSTPWWQEVGEFGRADRPVLRLLHGDRPTPVGGRVTYLAEVSSPPAGLLPAEVTVAAHPRRAAYAEVGGPAAALAWARAALDVEVTAHQQRTWNLSAIWRLDGADGRPVAWLKQVPSFFAHEPAVLRLVDRVAPGLVPSLIADGPDGRMLLAHVDGEDRYGAGAGVCERIAEAFHPVQVALAGHEPGVIPDGRFDADRIRRVAQPWFGAIAGLEKLVDGLPARFAAVAECGLPDTLVHGDLHPGNVRTDATGRLTVLDWGDCTIGHPAFDILRLTEGLDDPEPLVRRWAYRWTESRPGTEPIRAVELLRPVAALRAAVTYAGFLEQIEPSEWPYHAHDVPERLAAALG